MSTNGMTQDPPEMLRMVLSSAKKMDVPFEDVWKRALQKAVKAARWDDKADWREAMEAIKDEWQAAYENRETELSRAFAGLGRVQE